MFSVAERSTAREQGYCISTIVFFLITVLSSLIFIFLVNEPVFDDQYNLTDVVRYTDEGLSITNLQDHVNPTGPGSFIWMASAGWIFGNDLRVFRLAILVSWVLLAAFALVFDRLASAAGIVCCGMLTTVAFPHTATATATILTEGPALLFAFSGGIVWSYCLNQPRLDASRIALLLLSAFISGLAIVCRQYYAALIPGIAVFAFLVARTNRWQNRRWWIFACASGLTALIPVLSLFFVWGGLTSPGMAFGTSYANQTAHIGLSLLRPIISLFYVAIYLLPVSFPSFALLTRKQRSFSTYLACVGAIVFIFIGHNILQLGPIYSLVQVASRFPLGNEAILATLGFLAVFNTSNLILVFKSDPPEPTIRPYVYFSAFVVLFFVIEQIGVGGNIQFYERYVLQIAPFIGIVGFGIVRGFRRVRIGVMAVMLVSSIIMLWRHAL